MGNKKLINLFIFIGILLISIIGYFIYDNLLDNGVVDNQVLNHLEAVAYSKAERVKSFLEERKNDLEFLTSDKEIIEIFESNEVDEKINEKLKFYQETNEYLDLILIDINGDILWSAKQKEIIGDNLEGDESTKLGEVYNKVKNDFGVGIFDPGYYGADEKLSVFVTSPVLVHSESVIGKKDMIGIIVLQIDNSQIEERVQSDVGLGKSGKIYLVNRDGTVTAGLEGVNEIDTQMSKDCFKDYNNYYFERQGQEIEKVEGSGSYVNYNGESIFGAHQYILQTGWCVMVEVEKNEFYNSLKEAKWINKNL